MRRLRPPATTKPTTLTGGRRLKDQVISNSATTSPLASRPTERPTKACGSSDAAARSTAALMPATSSNVKVPPPDELLRVGDARRPTTSMATEAGASSSSTSAGAPVDISAAMAWAAK